MIICVDHVALVSKGVLYKSWGEDNGMRPKDWRERVKNDDNPRRGRRTREDGGRSACYVK